MPGKKFVGLMADIPSLKGFVTNFAMGNNENFYTVTNRDG